MVCYVMSGVAILTRWYAEVDSRSMSPVSQVRIAETDSAYSMEGSDIVRTEAN